MFYKGFFRCLILFFKGFLGVFLLLTSSSVNTAAALVLGSMHHCLGNVEKRKVSRLFPASPMESTNNSDWDSSSCSWYQVAVEGLSQVSAGFDQERVQATLALHRSTKSTSRGGKGAVSCAPGVRPDLLFTRMVDPELRTNPT